jgi:hypothetical protein
MESKYAHLLKTLSFKASPMGSANARQMVYLGSDTLEGFQFNTILGEYETTGDWAPNRGAHSHSFDEVLIFFGYDPHDMNYLGSDMSLSLGQEWEVHKFNTPTVVPAPKGSAHCPLVTEKVYQPFGHFHLALSPQYGANRVLKEGVTDGNKYTSSFKKMIAKKGPGGADEVQTVEFSGKQLDGLDINFTMSLYNKPGSWSVKTHSHPYDEVLVFFGHNTADMTDLGAEITVELGPEHEKHTFNKSTAICLPKGFPHFPVICNSLARPYRLMQIGLAPQYLVA